MIRNYPSHHLSVVDLLEELATEAEPGRSHDVAEQCQDVPDVSTEKVQGFSNRLSGE
jgi:hypothetical protein